MRTSWPFSKSGRLLRERLRLAEEQLERQERERQEEELLKKKRREREQREREEKLRRLTTVSPESLRELRELIRTRYALDMKIWSLRNVRKPDRGIVRDMMERSDAVLGEILGSVQAWDGTEWMWSPREWERAQEVRARLLAEGKRLWAGNPPWEEE